MYDLIPIEIAGSAMTAQRVRMGVIASNLANAQSTRQADGSGPYQRRVVVLKAGTMPAFQDMLVEANKKADELSVEPDHSRWLAEEHLRGVEVTSVEKDPATRTVYMPEHPDADADGNVVFPDISTMQEMVDMISASRNYEANVAVVKNTRDMILKLVELMKT